MAKSTREKKITSLSEEELRALLSNKETLEDFQKYVANSRWFNDHFDEIVKEHAGKVVGVLDNKIQFSDEDLQRIRMQIRSAPYLNQVYFRYVPQANEVLLL